MARWTSKFGILALLLGSGLGTATWSQPMQGLAAWQEPDGEALETLLERLSAWLDTNSPYPAQDSPPKVKFVSLQEARLRHGAGHDRYLSGDLRGLYDAGTRSINLVAPWDFGDMRDVSVLLHELVHDRQQMRHWYCAAEQEEDAYRLQERWLASYGFESGFYWPAIILQSSCTPRDIHPD